METIKVLVVDDHVLFRRGVLAVLSGQPEIEVVADVASGREAVAIAKEIRPTVVLTDLHMPEMGGVEATRILATEVPETNVLVLTVSDKDEDLFDAIKAGAKGYLLKFAEPEELVRAIVHVAQGGVIISPVMAPKLLAEIKTPVGQLESEPLLSPREQEILQLIAEGLTDREIGEKLFISVNTAKTHLKNILAKLHLKSRVQIAAYRAKTPGTPENEIP